MKISLAKPIEVGERHSFRFSRSGGHPSPTIDYVWRGTALLHLRVDKARQRLVLNDKVLGHWRSETVLPFPEAGAESLALTLRFPEFGARVSLDETSHVAFDRDIELKDADHILCDDSFSFSRVDAPAGVAPAPVGVPVGVAEAPVGALTFAGASGVRGWACDARRPGVPVAVELLVNGQAVAQVLADRGHAGLRRARPDLATHGFTHRFDPPLELAEGADVVLEARVGGRLLLHSPWFLARRLRPETPKAGPEPVPQLVSLAADTPRG
ncbi:hypothetical protein [Falsiroseomonas tokyonensis]|uniref:Uncharacterized protein n=1 Tax=Falsiroseomonas tokyonensis TaxID=430521 RepID=A0ABV7BLG0_9PROT|nr:hypothetical protein [Falsiroseomonas tokyonensis]MBU8536413.1 hypothetical protein [Falsiroseomonas tokyonensis]